MSRRLVATIRVVKVDGSFYQAEVIDDEGDSYAVASRSTAEHAVCEASQYVDELALDMEAEDASD